MKISNIVLASAAVALIPSFTRAEKVDEPVCVDLHRASCAPGEITDPTGTTKNLLFTMGPAHALHPELRSELKNESLTLIKDQKFRKTVLRLNVPSECTGDGSNDTCLEALSQAMAIKFEARFFTGQPVPDLSVANEGKIQDLLSVLNSQQIEQLRLKEFESFSSRFGERELVARVEKEIFPRLKESLLDQASMIDDEKARALVTQRLQAVQWGGSGCGVEPLAIMMTPDVFMNPQDNKIYLCRGISRLGTSEYMIAYLMAREIAHFVGPCGITRGKSVPAFKYSTSNKLENSETEFPFRGVLSCLRGKSSVYAQRGLGLSREPVAFCDKSDQVSESFADWFATEVVADYANRFLQKLPKKEKKFGWINAMKSQCLPTSGLELADRPPIEERFNHILLVHPFVRSEMGCSVQLLDASYCAVATGPIEGKTDAGEQADKTSEGTEK
jgi:hypothetical protein